VESIKVWLMLCAGRKVRERPDKKVGRPGAGPRAEREDHSRVDFAEKKGEMKYGVG